jgi:uncharacterized protein (DUF1501 family)
MGMSRRKFLGMAGGAAGGVAVGGAAWAGLVRDNVEGSASGTTTTLGTIPVTTTTLRQNAGRVLVIVQMSGGNDALNTVVPAGDGRYYDLRPNVNVAESDVLRLAGDEMHGFHPALAPLMPMWDAGRLGVLQGIGFEGQSRSHFSSMDTWWSATPGEARTTGWLGRWLDATGDGSNPLRAVSLGVGSPALVGDKAQATFVSNPAQFALRTPPGVSAEKVADAFLASAEPLSSDPFTAAAQDAIPSTFEALSLLARAKGLGEDDIYQSGGRNAFGPGNSSATQLLETAAGIVDLDVGTQVIVVGISGFDTHASQEPKHGELLADVAGGISAFLDTMEAQGRTDDVLVMTTSEFGRRAGENFSGGTDHGNGGTLFATGSAVNGAIVGSSDLVNLDHQGDLPLQHDARSLYAGALDWLGGPTEEILGGSYDSYELISA